MWGNGTERKEKLEAAGYNYAEVQAIVNERAGNKTENKADNKKGIAEIAQEVVAGKWGNGSERKQRLEAEGYNYAEVQAAVNNIMGKSQPNKKNVAEKKQFLLEHQIALWDVIASCDIIGSSDSSIKNVVANDIGRVLSEAPIRQIFVNGQTAFKLYKKYVLPETGVMPVCLPSTSPANAAWNMEKLTEAWQVIVRES